MNKPITLDIKNKIISLFEENICGNQIYHLIYQIASFASLRFLTEEQYKDQIIKNMISFETILDDFSRPTLSKKRQKGNEKNYRRPSFPRRSPLFLTSEMNLINGLIKEIWRPLEELRNDFFNWITHLGYNKLIEHIAKIMNLRWNLMAKFAHLTTKRLQEIQELKIEATRMRKAQISLETLRALLSKRVNPQQLFANEILYLIPDKELSFAIKHLNRGVIDERQDIITLLNYHIYLLYQTEGVIISQQEVKNPEGFVILDENKIARAISNLDDLDLKINLIVRFKEQGVDLIAHKAPGRLENLKGLRKNIRKCLKAISEIPEREWEVANKVRLLSRDRDWMSLKIEAEAALEEAMQLILNIAERFNLKVTPESEDSKGDA